MAPYQMWAVEWIDHKGVLHVHVFDRIRDAKQILLAILAQDLKGDLWELTEPKDAGQK